MSKTPTICGTGRIRIGTAGWAIPRAVSGSFPALGSALARYGARFDAAEINSTFYRSHRPQTYGRWGASVPDDFRFAVKLPKTITHERRLVDAEQHLVRFLDEIAVLGPQLGPVLVQLPPSFAFEEQVAERFFGDLRAAMPGRLGRDVEIVCEPRHPTWFSRDANRILGDRRVSRVAADPAAVPEADAPGGYGQTAYFRLHGSPRMYFSLYERTFLDDLAARLRQSAGGPSDVWCIFDNTASGAAAANALELQRLLGHPPLSEGQMTH